MKLLGLMPVLWTDDLPGTAAFYTEVLGFRCNDDPQKTSWLTLCRGEVCLSVMNPSRDEDFSQAEFSGSLYFTVDDIDEAWQRLKDAAHVAYPIDDFDSGMREFAIYDNNGYLLQFGQALSG